MGLNTSIGKLLVRARLHGANFTRTVTIGRQSLAIPKKDLKSHRPQAGVPRHRLVELRKKWVRRRFLPRPARLREHPVNRLFGL
jgi:hypothetical protein